MAQGKLLAARRSMSGLSGKADIGARMSESDLKETFGFWIFGCIKTPFRPSQIPAVIIWLAWS